MIDKHLAFCYNVHKLKRKNVMNEKHVVTKNANNTEKDITLNEKVQRVLEQIRKENRGEN